MKPYLLWKDFLTFYKDRQLNFSAIRLIKLMNYYINSNMKFYFEFLLFIQNRQQAN